MNHAPQKKPRLRALDRLGFLKARSPKGSRVDIEDQILFFILFAIGATSIWMLKSFGLSQFIVTAVPVGLMGLYVVVALVTERYRIREDRVGDNIYYLGFLYTLTSLAHALYVYDPEGAGATAIITNFGIAIFTTIIGLAGRVFFNQMRVDPVEYEREARLSLAQTSSELRARLGDIAAEASIFKSKLFQILEEGVTEMSDAARSALEDNLRRFAGTSNEAVESIRTAFGGFTDHAGRLNEIASKNVEALEALFRRIEKIEASPELIATKLDPVMEKFSAIADEAMRRGREDARELERLRSLIEAAASAAESMQGTVSQLDGAWTEKIEAMTNALGGNASVVAAFGKSMSDTTTVINGQLAASKEIVSAMEAAKAAHAQTLNDMRAAIESDLELARKHRQDMARLAEESRAAVAEVEQSLISLTRTLAEQLGGH